MRAVLQRVSRAQVYVADQIIGKIGPGLLVLLGFGQGDSLKEADAFLDKMVNLRIFEDPQGKMNLSLLDVGGEMMIISQFTLYADCRKGRRPSFIDALEPNAAKSLYETFITRARDRGIKVTTGSFQAKMDVELVNSGPVTILLDSSVGF